MRTILCSEVRDCPDSNGDKKMKTVLLKDGSTGDVEMGEVGEVVTVATADENGNSIELTDEIVEILEEKEPWE